MTQREIEKRTLLITMIVNAIITAAGIWVYLATELQIMFLAAFLPLTHCCRPLMPSVFQISAGKSLSIFRRVCICSSPCVRF